MGAAPLVAQLKSNGCPYIARSGINLDGLCQTRIRMMSECGNLLACNSVYRVSLNLRCEITSSVYTENTFNIWMIYGCPCYTLVF
jgi:hypothetical protein